MLSEGLYLRSAATGSLLQAAQPWPLAGLLEQSDATFWGWVNAYPFMEVVLVEHHSQGERIWFGAAPKMSFWTRVLYAEVVVATITKYTEEEWRVCSYDGGVILQNRYIYLDRRGLRTFLEAIDNLYHLSRGRVTKDVE